jgi:hypothetical protein
METYKHSDRLKRLMNRRRSEMNEQLDVIFESFKEHRSSKKLRDALNQLLQVSAHFNDIVNNSLTLRSAERSKLLRVIDELSTFKLDHQGFNLGYFKVDREKYELDEILNESYKIALEFEHTICERYNNIVKLAIFYPLRCHFIVITKTRRVGSPGLMDFLN